MRTIVALLPMKAHSERIPGKNFKLLSGKPLYSWILESLLDIPEITKIIINTDARSALESSGFRESERVEIHDRPEELCGDFVSMNRIIEFDIEQNPSDLYLMTHTTNPLLSSSTISSAIDALDSDKDSDSLFTVSEWRTRLYDAQGNPVNHNPDELLRTQDLDPLYEENSCLYLFTKQSFSVTRARIGSAPILFPTSRVESIDIDEPSDWTIAEALVTHANGSAGG